MAQVLLSREAWAEVVKGTSDENLSRMIEAGLNEMSKRGLDVTIGATIGPRDHSIANRLLLASPTTLARVEAILDGGP